MGAKRVLIVDDEPEVTFALQAYFVSKGYEMVTALDGLQAMRYIRQQPIDLVLLDMKMPGVNGLEVLKFLHSTIPSAKVIVVTAYDDQFQETVERLGVDGFLIKPFGIEALTKTIEEVLSGTAPAPFPRTEERAVLSGSVPRAKLLFIEPSEYTYQPKEVFFSSREKCQGEYEVMGVFSAQDALGRLREFHPDILLVDLSMLRQAGELPVRVMASEEKPKEIIIHGLSAVLPHAQSVQVEDLTRQGIKVLYNESFTRAGLIRLSEVIRKTALAKGLCVQAPP